MINIMIIEDQYEKMNDIEKLLTDNFSTSVQFKTFTSIHSALREIAYGNDYDLVILDMSMPTYDISDDEPSGGTSESFAGKDILYQMMLRNKKHPTVILTQYMSFKKGTIELKDLDDEFKSEFKDFYLGYIYYNSTVNDWKNALKTLIDGIVS